MLRKKVTEGRTARPPCVLTPTLSLQGLALSPLSFPKPLPLWVPLCASSRPAESAITPKGPHTPSPSTFSSQVLPFHWRGNPAPERGVSMQRRHRSPCPPSVVSPQYLTYEIGNTSNPTTNNNNGDDDPSELPGTWVEPVRLSVNYTP